MKKFLVFGCAHDHPSGGLSDLIYQTDDIMEVIDPHNSWLDYHKVTMLNTETGICYELDGTIWREIGLLKTKEERY